MKRIKYVYSLFLFLCLSATAVWAQIDPGGVVNADGYQLSALPNGKIAQGSIFAIFSMEAKNIGPAQSQGPVRQFPLPNELADVSVKVSVGGITEDCPLFFVSSTQVLALMPSATPQGEGEIELKFGSQTYTEPVEVVAASFGIFTQNTAGTGAAIVQNFAEPPLLNQLTASIEPGGVAILWGTGLGAVEGDEAAGPLPGALETDLDLYVGGVLVDDAAITYHGRSGCCTGVDQINFTVPEGVTGCYVPVVVVINGIPSNSASLSIADEGGTCSVPGLIESADLDELLSGDDFRLGAVTLTRNSNTVSVPGSSDVKSSSDNASGTFVSFDSEEFQGATLPFNLLNVGGCSVFSFRGDSPEMAEPLMTTGLEAGAQLTLMGTAGTKLIARTEAGAYSLNLGGEGPGATGPPYLNPGAFTVAGPGGTDVGLFNATLNVPAAITWTNQATTTTVSKSEGVTITWTGGNATTETVRIFGSSVDVSDEENPFGAAFFCTADVSAGSFTVGPEVLGALPTSGAALPTGFLGVGASSAPVTFEATGLDLGLLNYQIMTTKNVSYEE